MHTIKLPDGDELIPDADYAGELNTTPRTLSNYEKLPDGLPYVMVAGRKYRPRKRCGEWWIRRIKNPSPRRAA